MTTASAWAFPVPEIIFGTPRSCCTPCPDSRMPIWSTFLLDAKLFNSFPSQCTVRTASASKFLWRFSVKLFLALILSLLIGFGCYSIQLGQFSSFSQFDWWPLQLFYQSLECGRVLLPSSKKTFHFLTFFGDFEFWELLLWPQQKLQIHPRFLKIFFTANNSEVEASLSNFECNLRFFFLNQA